MHTEPSQLPAGDLRVLLLPLTSRDAQAISKVLSAAGISCNICESVQVLCDQLSHGAGAIVIAEEVLSSNVFPLVACVQAQPVWSDLPIIVLSRAGMESPKLEAVVSGLGNVTVLERPVRMTTLLSLVRSALQARQRQYQIRDHIAMLARAEENLRANEQGRLVLLESERRARADAERASRMKDEFLATLSHELRTPLNAILGWTHILTTSNRGEEDVAEGLRTIERNARAQTQIIEDLLDMSKIVSGKVRLVIQQVNIQRHIDATRAMRQRIGTQILQHVVEDPDGH